MSSLFIAGNGFDIAHNISTKYSDFRTYLINMYPQSLKFRDAIVYLEDAENINIDDFAAEILLHTMDNAAGENWCDFEDALAYINFNGKLPEANHKENETEKEYNDLMKQYLLYIDMLTSCFINCSKIWQELFRKWIKHIQEQIDKNKFSGKSTLISLFSEPNIIFFTFNYTKTLQKIYGIKKVIHIHNRVGQKLIFGHGKDDITYGECNITLSNGTVISSSFLDDMITSFKKDTSTQLKKYSDEFKKLDS